MNTQQQALGAISESRHITYPINRVSGAVAVADVETVVADLTANGFPAASIEAHSGEAAARRFRDVSERKGIRGAMRRFVLSLGADLDMVRQAEHELDAGNALVDVVVHGDQAKRQVRDLFLRHRAHFITHFGRWTIATLA